MSEKPENSMPCSRCSEPSTHKQGHQFLCPKHYRFGQMRAGAKRHGKAVPTHAQLELMATLTCPDCGISMNWLARDGQATVASLQHYRDGTLGLVCRSCNTRHAHMEGDSYRHLPRGHKLCPKCNLTLPDSEYFLDRGRSGSRKLKSWCKPCSNKAHQQWQQVNREYYNSKQREYRAKRKTAATVTLNGGAA